MTDPPIPLAARAVREEDAAALSSFMCAGAPTYQRDVESFIQERAFALAIAPRIAYRLLVFYDDDRLVACAGHHPEGLLLSEDELVVGRRLHVVALSLDDQGRRLPDGRRVSDVVMETTIDDALRTEPTDVITAIVARENHRSIAMCERNGLRSQVVYDDLHVRLSGRFKKRE